MRRFLSLRFLTVAQIAVLAVAVLGCGGGGEGGRANGPATVAVSGVVTYKGTPVDGAIVTFHSANGTQSAFGKTDAKGRYQLTTFESGDGAVPGEYQVTTKKTQISGGDELPEDHPDYGKAPIAESTVTELLPARYGSPETSGLTATVKEGSNDLPFALED